MTDDDRVAYLAGEDGTDVDDGARADLEELRALLADEAVWATPPEELEDAVVAAIGAAAGSRPAGTPPASTPSDARPAAPTGEARSTEVTPLARRRRGALRLVVSAAAAAVVALAVAGVVVLRGGDDAPAFSMALEATELLPDAGGSARLERTGSGWRIELDATGLPRLDGGRFYQAWLRSADEVLIPIGTFNEGADVVLWAGVSPQDFPTLTVTEEDADGDQGSSGRRVLVGTIEGS